MKKLHIVVFNLLICGIMCAQQIVSKPAQHWTAEQIATRQTERVTRELNIRDSVLNDTLFQIYLYYAQQRQQGLSREQSLQNLASLYEALKGVLSEEQYKQFMQNPAESHPRIPMSNSKQIHQ